jgi:ATP-binding cassette, subfamily B, bacterial PglK
MIFKNSFLELKNILAILKNCKINIFILLFLITINTLLEILSIASFVPIFSYLINDGKNSILEIFLNKNLNVEFDMGINFFLFVIVVAFLIKFIFQLFYVQFKSLFFYKIHLSVSNRIFSNYLISDYLSLIKVNSSHIVRNVISETQSFINLLKSIIEIFQNFLTLIMLMIILIFISLKYTILILFFYSFIAYFIYRLLKQKNLDLGTIRQKNNFFLIKYIRETFQSIIDIKMLNLENYLKKKFNISNSNYLGAFQKQGFLVSIPKLVIEVMVIVSFSSLIFFMVKTNISNENILFLSSVLGIIFIRLLPLIPNFLMNIQSILFSYPSLTILKYQILENLTKTKDYKEIIFKEKVKKITLSEISFSFEDKEIIKKFNFIFEFGKNYYISGDSGSGKSTLLNLISGLLKSNKGKIFVNNILINKLNNYHSIISYVPQEVSLIDDTFLKNITFEENSKNINYEELNKIIEICFLRNVIKSLPDGINTILGERGIFISGGEKQRIGIARALYKNSPILIFDEATNSLNKEIGDKIFDYCINNNKQIFIFTTHNNQIAKEKIIEIKL